MYIIDWGSLDEEQINDDSLKRCLEHVGRLQRHSHLALKSHKRLFTESRNFTDRRDRIRKFHKL